MIEPSARKKSSAASLFPVGILTPNPSARLLFGCLSKSNSQWDTTEVHITQAAGADLVGVSVGIKPHLRPVGKRKRESETRAIREAIIQGGIDGVDVES